MKASELMSSLAQGVFNFGVEAQHASHKAKLESAKAAYSFIRSFIDLFCTKQYNVRNNPIVTLVWMEGIVCECRIKKNLFCLKKRVIRR